MQNYSCPGFLLVATDCCEYDMLCSIMFSFCVARLCCVLFSSLLFICLKICKHLSCNFSLWLSFVVVAAAVAAITVYHFFLIFTTISIAIVVATTNQPFSSHAYVCWHKFHFKYFTLKKCLYIYKHTHTHSHTHKYTSISMFSSRFHSLWRFVHSSSCTL